jgi:cell division transport system ATP-binding protein
MERPRKHGAVTHGPEGSDTNTMVQAEQRPAAAATNGAAVGVNAPGPLVQLHGVTKRYGRLVALRNVDLTIAPGEFLFLIGPSEAGKTTLLKLIHGDLRPTQGTVRVADHQLHKRWGRSLTRLRREVAAAFQDHRLLPDMTARGNVAFALEVADLWLPRWKVRAAAQARLDEVGLGHRAGAYPHQLSGGQQRRLSIARALGHDSMLLLADEPTANLDRRNAERVLELLESCCLAGATVVVATHDVDLALSRPHRVVEIRQGRVVADRPARAIIPREAAVARLAAAGARKVPLRERIGRVSRAILGYTPPPPPLPAAARPARPSRPRVAMTARAGGAVRTVLGFVPPPRGARRGKPATGAWRPPAEVVARLSNGHANGATANGNGHAARGPQQPPEAIGRPYVAQAPAPETVSIWRPPPGLQALTASTAALRGAGLTRPPRRRLRLGRRAAGLVRRALGRPPLPAPAEPEDARPLHERAGALWARAARLVLGYTPPPPGRPRPEPAGPVSRWRRPWLPVRNVGRLVVGGAAVSWARNFGTVAPALGSITLLLLLVGVLSVSGVAVRNLLETQQSEASVLHVYLSDGATSDQVDQARQDLATLAHVRSVTYVDKDQALAQARHRPGLADLASASATNPFPASLDVQVDQPGSLAAVAKAAAAESGVDTRRPTSYDADTYQRLRQFTVVAATVAGGFGLLVLIVTYAISSNAIRAAVLARRDELVTMRLVGASAWLIRTRLGVEGALTGLLAALIAAAAVAGLCAAAFAGARHLFVQLLPGVGTATAAEVVVGVLAAGLLLGAIPALFALRRLGT